jgi:uncharacterized protein
MRKLRKTQLEDIVVGAGLLGAGGGGSVKEGMKLVNRVLEFADEVKLISPQEIGDSDHGAVIAGMGSPKASLDRVRTNSPRISLEMLEKELGFKSDFVVPFEIGAGNSLNPMLAAVQKEIPIVDGDPVGRAVPELHMTTFHLGGISMSPLALSTEDNIKILIQTEKPEDIERIARAVTAELQGVSAISCNVVNGIQAKDLIIPGTTTLVEQIGNLIRQQREKGTDPSEAVAEKFNGYILGKGKVSEVKGETRGGFDFGVVQVSGDLPVTVYFQNENMLVYRDTELIAVVPDLICAIAPGGDPLTNADIEAGMEIVYIGFPAPDAFRGANAFALFHEILSALGYSEGFMPVERLNQR